MQAETLSIVRQKLKYTAGEKGDGMSMLVAEDAENPGGILGCVDVSIQTGKVCPFNVCRIFFCIPANWMPNPLIGLGIKMLGASNGRGGEGGWGE